MTPLILACIRGNAEIAALLLNRGALIEAKSNTHGYTPLMCACIHGNVEVAALLLDRGALIEAKDNDGGTPFLLACSKGHVEIAALLLNRGALIEAKDISTLGYTALMWACIKGHVEVATLLLDRGALIEANDDTRGYTPLMFACENGNVEVAALLLNRGALIEAKDNDDNTALHHAAHNDKMNVCELLISRGADPMAVNNQNHTPLDDIGLSRDENDPDDLDDDELLPLTAAEKKERHDRLLEVFGEYLEWLRREDNWTRRAPFMMFLVGSGFRPLLAEMEATAAAQVPVDTSAPIAPVPRDWNYLTNQVFAHNPRVDDPEANNANEGGGGDFVELINAFL